MKIKNLLLFLVVTAFFVGCSTAPKRTSEITTERDAAENMLNSANQTANRGRYAEALLILVEARRLALGTDDPSLRIRTSISRGNILFSLEREAEAFAEWEAASLEADSSNESVLASLARIYTIRGKLMSMADEAGTVNADAIEELKTLLAGEMTNVRADVFSTASAYVTLGLAEKLLGRFSEAESAIRQALNIHERNDSLEDAAYDWFLVASIRSVAGNYEGALEALQMAIRIDRRLENGFGLASSWQAMGDVYRKAGRYGESEAAWRRAADIYRAIGLEDHAAKLEGE